ncbi:MAG: ATP-binding protein [Sulfurospirillaceae bacterium]|nr:ATP-binding protein [Sulfurospirillaceae bacterium]MDD2825583.1 ATP-binding protein [Sulfurospirillaceae bacterium]
MAEPLKNKVDEEAGVCLFEPLSEKYKITFEAIGGLEALKKQASMKIIQPFKNPELFKKFKKSAGGGILLYGPPGCGKSYFARAIAGECNASFYNIGIDQILDMYVGNSEKNIKALFDTARANRPTVIFIDEIDALGRKRELLRHTNMTSTINAFLAQMDGVESDNENILIIGATNAPWDVDSAFRRTGRFDRIFFVPPPDEEAREQIFSLYLHELPIGKLNYNTLAAQTANYSGADIHGLIDRVSEKVIEDILETEKECLIEETHLEEEIVHSKPTTMEWFAMAKNVVEYANENGIYDELAHYMHNEMNKKSKKMGFL